MKPKIAKRRRVASKPFRQSGRPVHPSVLMLLVLLSICVGCKQSSEAMQSGESSMPIEITSTAFEQGMSIPSQYTGDGADQSPPLRWSELPSGTKSIALICDDPDAPRGTWVHWVLFNLPPGTRELEEGVPTTATLPSGAKQGKNDFGNIGYGGPAPPKGKPHRYFFNLYALAVVVDLPPGATKAELVDAMKGHVLAEGQLMGTYKR
jgi:Raf kinase inhibitor-like YbhB/YbcL family protein